MATEIENLRGALRGMLNPYTPADMLADEAIRVYARTRKTPEQQETAIKSLLDALDLAEATIERLGLHAPGSFQGTIDVICAAREAAQ